MIKVMTSSSMCRTGFHGDKQQSRSRSRRMHTVRKHATHELDIQYTRSRLRKRNRMHSGRIKQRGQHRGTHTTSHGIQYQYSTVCHSSCQLIYHAGLHSGLHSFLLSKHSAESASVSKYWLDVHLSGAD